MKVILLTKNKEVIVDDEDFEWLNQFKWFWQQGKWGGYAGRRKDGKTILMHRFIMGTPKGIEVDHINNNGLDNRRKNLRNVTSQQNKWNMSLPRHNSSGYKGVQYANIRGNEYYVAYIKFNGKKKTLGYFKNKLEAAKCYDNKAKELFGEYAKLNLRGY